VTTILQYSYDYPYLNGAITATIDAYFNLGSFQEGVYYHILSNDVGKTVQLLRANNLDVLLQTIDTLGRCVYEDDCIILTYSMVLDRERLLTELEIKCKKLIILGTLECYYEPFEREKMPAHWKFDEIYMLNNPPMYLWEPYYHKLSLTRLENLSPLSIKKMDTMGVYCRERKYHGKMYNPVAFENVGKLIFEACYLNRPVYYDPRGMPGKDGLYYYLALFGIDGYDSSYIDRPLPITKEQVIEKLTMHEDDYLIHLTKG